MSRSLDILYDEYFDWMYGLVCHEKRLSYRLLLSYLHSKEFTYTIELDGNRAEDGEDLRYRFANEYDRLHRDMIVNHLDNIGTCSVLEMLVALSIRCEEHIMDDSDIGDRTDQWFWNMIDNLGLSDMDDNDFNERHTETVIDRLLNRDYSDDGKGGLFTVKNSRRDLRTVEIWYQMCWYLDNLLWV